MTSLTCNDLAVNAAAAALPATHRDPAVPMPAGYRPGWQEPEDTRDFAEPFQPTTPHEAWWLGFSLGLEGLDVEPAGHYDEAMRAEFQRGYDGGYDDFLADREADAAAYWEWIDSLGSPEPDFHELVESRADVGHPASEA